MPLILAIEPDRRQSAKLVMLARNQLHADLIVATSVQQALTTLDEQVPDLLLASPLIPARDSVALADRLRELDAEGLRVHTVVIPALAVPGQRPRPQSGAPGSVRGRSLSQVAAGGCDPVVFGLQISAHLDRVAAERPLHPRRPAPPPAHALQPLPGDAAIEEALHGDEADGAAEQPMAASSSEADWRDPSTPDWSEVLSAMQRDIASAVGVEERLPATVDLVVPDWQPVDVQPELVVSLPPIAVEIPAPSSPAEVAAGRELPGKKRRRKAPPQDEWGFFDPDRCGLSALITKVNQTGNRTGSAKKPA